MNNNSEYIKNKLKNVDNEEEKIKILTECLPFIRSTKKFDHNNNIYTYFGKSINGSTQFKINSEIMSMPTSKSELKRRDNCFGFFKSVGTFDQREFWKSLKIFPCEITKELYNSYVYPRNYDELILEYKPKNIDVGYLASKLSNLSNYDATFSTEENTIENDYIFINKADAYYDIKIYGATFAFIVLANRQQIVMDYNKEGEYFTFNDITIKNPIIPSCDDYYSKLKIETNGKFYILKKIYFNSKIFSCYLKLTNTYYLNWFPSKNLVMCNGFDHQPSFICKIDEMVPADFEE